MILNNPLPGQHASLHPLLKFIYQSKIILRIEHHHHCILPSSVFIYRSQDTSPHQIIIITASFPPSIHRSIAETSPPDQHHHCILSFSLHLSIAEISPPDQHHHCILLLDPLMMASHQYDHRNLPRIKQLYCDVWFCEEYIQLLEFWKEDINMRLDSIPRFFEEYPAHRSIIDRFNMIKVHLTNQIGIFRSEIHQKKEEMRRLSNNGIQFLYNSFRIERGGRGHRRRI